MHIRAKWFTAKNEDEEKLVGGPSPTLSEIYGEGEFVSSSEVDGTSTRDVVTKTQEQEPENDREQGPKHLQAVGPQTNSAGPETIHFPVHHEEEPSPHESLQLLVSGRYEEFDTAPASALDRSLAGQEFPPIDPGEATPLLPQQRQAFIDTVLWVFWEYILPARARTYLMNHWSVSALLAIFVCVAVVTLLQRTGQSQLATSIVLAIMCGFEMIFWGRDEFRVCSRRATGE
ncbi:putative integral membrane protein [Clavispora lusitaniae]|uniref:putative integral membrane protein n=1 Tax=Clavispora lusitaniae TaxID=36911 RepID=UPI00202C3265|nr:putative integral membrane protein [Clavispora lusitaniae]